jgi:hypothetical protein
MPQAITIPEDEYFWKWAGKIEKMPLRERCVSLGNCISFLQKCKNLVTLTFSKEVLI